MDCLPVVGLHGVPGLKPTLEMRLGLCWLSALVALRDVVCWKDEVVEEGDAARLKQLRMSPFHS
jgi:hypothetical protein